MWIFHPIGFFSVVRDPTDDELLVVRARVRDDLEGLRSQFLPELSITETTRERDYPFRGRCLPEQWATAVARMALTITYSNFKSEVQRVHGPARGHLYHDVWQVMHSAEGKLEAVEDPPWTSSPPDQPRPKRQPRARPRRVR